MSYHFRLLLVRRPTVAQATSLRFVICPVDRWFRSHICGSLVFTVARYAYTGCGKKVAPLMVFANFSAVVPEFKVKFGTLVSSSNLHLTAKYHLISF